MTHQCPACQRTFAESGFCPFDGAQLVAAGAGGNAGVPTQLSMAMPSQRASDLISAQISAQVPAQNPTIVAEPSTGEITNTQSRPPPAQRQSEPVRSVSASENPQDVLASMKASRASEYDKLVGQTLDGRYYVIKKLGEGGMGVVFAVKHAVIDRPLAIKVLKREVMRDTATIRRFVQEAKAASRIGHPNIVDVTDFGTTPDGMTYSVMEYIAGATLGQAIRASAPFDVQRVLRIGAQIARALGAAHDKGIVHRDLKPENVFLVDRDGRIDFVKIVDFGIAKVTPVEGQEAGPRLTRAGSVFGTPEYMAPEQAAGRSDNDGRVDIYALGVILYEMLVGRVPHKGDTMVRTLAMQMLDPAEPPSKVRPDLNIPPALEEVVLHALAKKREHRYQTMGELLAALEKVQREALPPPVATSVTGSPMYALAPLPPGADPTTQTKLPAAPRDAQSPPAPPTLPSTSPPPTFKPQRSKSPTNNPASEPQFVTSEKPITFEHMLTDELLAPARPKRWPLLVVVIALVLGGAIGAVAFVASRKDTPTIPDAALARATPDAVAAADALAIVQVTGDAEEVAPTPDARVPHDAAGLVLLADAYVRVATKPRVDAPTGPVIDPMTHKGLVQVEILTKPDTATIYVGTSYRGPNGVKLEEPRGSRVEVRCQLRGYKPGTVTVVFDGKTEVVLCVLTRIKTCVGALKNPFDECPDDASGSGNGPTIKPTP